MLPPWHDILIIFLGYVRSAYGRPNITISEKRQLKNYQNIMPRWQHISYSVVVIDLTEKVQPGGDSWLQKLLCEYTIFLHLKIPNNTLTTSYSFNRFVLWTEPLRFNHSVMIEW